MTANKQTIERDMEGFRRTECDVFEMRGGKIRRLTSYLKETK
jgi:ketosteroid isomerase-like protein